MKVYIDDITLRDLLTVIVMLPQLLLAVVKEELFWWTKLYKYEINTPDWQKDREKGLAETKRRVSRMRRHH